MKSSCEICETVSSLSAGLQGTVRLGHLGASTWLLLFPIWWQNKAHPLLVRLRVWIFFFMSFVNEFPDKMLTKPHLPIVRAEATCRYRRVISVLIYYFSKSPGKWSRGFLINYYFYWTSNMSRFSSNTERPLCAEQVWASRMGQIHCEVSCEHSQMLGQSLSYSRVVSSPSENAPRHPGYRASQQTFCNTNSLNYKGHFWLCSLRKLPSFSSYHYW